MTDFQPDDLKRANRSLYIMVFAWWPCPAIPIVFIATEVSLPTRERLSRNGRKPVAKCSAHAPGLGTIGGKRRRWSFFDISLGAETDNCTVGGSGPHLPRRAGLRLADGN